MEEENNDGNHRMSKSETSSCTTGGTSSWDKIPTIDYSKQQSNSSVISDLSSSVVDILSFKSNFTSSPCSCAKDKTTSSTDSIPENSADEKKKDILPIQLSTVATAKELQYLKTADLIHSIIEIFSVKKPQTSHFRNICLFYYNWLIVDLCRRMELVEERFIRRYQEGYEEQLRRRVIMKAANEVAVHITKTGAFGITSDNEFFDYFAPFVPRKREKILRVVDIFGDEICLFTESIDMKMIGDMSSNDYVAFYQDLVLCKDSLKKRLGDITETSRFKGDPCQPYNKFELLNYK
ncbi:hypothetical protein INT45_010523 [Circinella minor]|uniref:Uncharacterized protein n=1 Tax=Circinella minor TaxID=1195481 RepID=A0A8H7SA25_9FUNG|nr:hypothetical protein INT45_010523 [Circinella minor]